MRQFSCRSITAIYEFSFTMAPMISEPVITKVVSYTWWAENQQESSHKASIKKGLHSLHTLRHWGLLLRTRALCIASLLWWPSLDNREEQTGRNANSQLLSCFYKNGSVSNFIILPLTADWSQTLLYIVSKHSNKLIVCTTWVILRMLHVHATGTIELPPHDCYSHAVSLHLL